MLIISYYIGTIELCGAFDGLHDFEAFVRYEAFEPRFRKIERMHIIKEIPMSLEEWKQKNEK